MSTETLNVFITSCPGFSTDYKVAVKKGNFLNSVLTRCSPVPAHQRSERVGTEGDSRLQEGGPRPPTGLWAPGRSSGGTGLCGITCPGQQGAPRTGTVTQKGGHGGAVPAEATSTSVLRGHACVPPTQELGIAGGGTAGSPREDLALAASGSAEETLI